MSPSERRGTERLALTIPIRVMAFGASRTSFTEDTCALEVNRAGARIALKHRVTPETVLRIINLQNLCEADFRVLGPTRLDGSEVAEWGVECLDLGRNIWGIEFPHPLDSAESRASALLECRGCGKQVLCILTFMEVEMLNSTGILHQLCDQCGQLSSWTYADPTRRRCDLPASDREASPQQPDKWDGKTERRAHRRLALKLPVLVRNSKGERETSKTENVSKGGLAVYLRMRLAVGEIVRIVCPYIEDGQDLEQKAEVRLRLTITAGEKWRYGLRYLS